MSNKREIIRSIVVFFLFWGSAFLFIDLIGAKEQTVTKTPGTLSPNNGSHPKKTSPLPFGVGEKLIYEISWYGIVAGISEITIQEKTLYRSHEVYRLVSRITSAGVVGKLYTVNDRLESFIDIQDLFPYYALLRQRQSKHHKDKDVYFDQKNQQVSYVTNGGRPRVLPTPPKVLDILSCLYYVRIQDLKVGTSIFLNVFSLKRNYEVEAKIVRKERMTVLSAEREVYLIKPSIFATDHDSQGGDSHIWLTADDKKLPVKIRTQIDLGRIDAVLIGYEG